MNAPPEPVTLIASYDAAIDAIVRETEATRAGDRIEAALYIIEPGASSERVIAAFADAARRGVDVEVSLDWTPASHLSRLWERTSTLWPAVRALAGALPDRVRAVQVRSTDHSKVLVFRRATGGPVEPSALLGSLNLGDRFRAWRDLLVRVEGRDAVEALLRARRGEPSAQGGTGTVAPVSFVANVPAAGVFPTRPALEALFGDPRLTRYRIAMAYLDRTGAALLHPALERGARVDLVLPRRANVYQHSNLRALEGLLRRDGGLVTARLHPAMVHAKAVLAIDGAGGGAALVGSANLKRNSIDRFGETAALATAPAFVAALDREMERLAAEAEPARPPLRYAAARAAIEERFG